MRSLFLSASSLLLAILLCLTAAAFAEESSADTLYVKKVENLDDGFILGMDVSSVLSLEACGVRYKDHNGAEKDLFQILSENGINSIRVRVWNDPYDTNGNGFGGGNCDIQKCAEIGKRAAQYGMQLIVDFHYSDFWADPGKQQAPRAWKSMEITEKSEALYAYTRECLLLLREANVPVRAVQLGNETNGKMCGEKTWFNIQYLLSAGSRAVREVYPEALVAVHFTNPEKAGNLEGYAKKLNYYAVDYDVFASSYYPYWHGTLDNLASVLSSVAETYGKKVMVLETSYAFTDRDTDFFGNTVSGSGTEDRPYPYTVQGQANAVRDVTDTIINKTKNGIGVVYWEGAWITAGGKDYSENFVLWEKYGSGWASTFARVYDPEDAGKYYGGCAVDNQAFFDADGRALESLKVFRLMREGNDVPPAADALEEALVEADIAGEIVLPEYVNAVMNDNSRVSVPVQWNFTAEDEKRIIAGGEGKYTVTGRAAGADALCTVKLSRFNFLQDPGFEEGGKGWVFTDLAGADELYVEEKKSDSLTGVKHAHFWSSAKNSVEFTLEQEKTGLKAGTYRFSVSIMGGDCGNTDIYAYVKVNGEIRGTAPMKITSYGSWDTASVPAFSVNDGDTVRVGVYVKCEGTGSGAWGKIDDAALVSAE